MNLPATLIPEYSELKSYPTVVLLVDDQMIIAEAIRRMLENEKDLTFHYCQDPSKAIEMATEIRPTVILQDLVMPSIDGLTLVKYFRANPATQEIPLVVLSTKEEPKVKAEAFALGANDYLVKIPDKIELIARIRYHSKAYISLLERNEAFEKMRESQHVLFSELSEAAQYVRLLLPAPMNDGVKTLWEFIPSQQLGGDAFSYHWIDEDHFAMYLLDVCGHGIGAALLSISIMNVLSEGIAANDLINPSKVLMTLNNMFLMEKHNNMFFTMWYGVFNKKTREIVYSSGGHPPAILFSGDSLENIEMFELRTPGLVVGGMPNTEYQNQSIKVGKYNKLFLFSDGVFELTLHKRHVHTLGDFVTFLKSLDFKEDDDIYKIVKFSLKINGQDNFPDDFSIVEFIFK